MLVRKQALYLSYKIPPVIMLIPFLHATALYLVLFFLSNGQPTKMIDHTGKQVTLGRIPTLLPKGIRDALSSAFLQIYNTLFWSSIHLSNIYFWLYMPAGMLLYSSIWSLGDPFEY